MKKAAIITVLSFLFTVALQAMQTATLTPAAEALALGYTLMAKGESKAALEWFFKVIESGNDRERKEAQKCIRLLLDKKATDAPRDDSQSPFSQWKRDLKILFSLVSKDVRITEEQAAELLIPLAQEVEEGHTAFALIENKTFIRLLSQKLKTQLVEIVQASEADFMLTFVFEILEDVDLIDQLISKDWDVLMSNPGFLLTHKVYSRGLSVEKESAFIAFLRMREAKKEILDEFIRNHKIISEEETRKAHDAEVERMRQCEEARQKEDRTRRQAEIDKRMQREDARRAEQDRERRQAEIDKRMQQNEARIKDLEEQARLEAEKARKKEAAAVKRETEKEREYKSTRSTKPDLQPSSREKERAPEFDIVHEREREFEIFKASLVRKPGEYPEGKQLLTTRIEKRLEETRRVAVQFEQKAKELGTIYGNALANYTPSDRLDTLKRERDLASAVAYSLRKQVAWFTEELLKHKANWDYRYGT